MVHYRIHEERAGVACNFRVGQFVLSYFDDGLAHLLCSRLGKSAKFEFGGQCGVGQIRFKAAVQSQRHMCHGIAARPLLLERAAPVGVAAASVCYGLKGAFLHIHYFYILYKVFGFGAIGTYVLHSCRSHFTGHEREVLQSVPTVVHAE